MRFARTVPTRDPHLMQWLLSLLVLAVVGFASEARAQGIVSNLDNSGPGSLRQAIADADPDDVISFNVSGTIVLTSELVIDKNLTIQGNGSVTVSGNSVARVFNVTNGSVNFDSLTIANGNTTTNDCGAFPATCGGGIMIQRSDGHITVANSTIDGSSAQYGGGIMSLGGQLTISNSTISNNSAIIQAAGLYMRAALDSTPGVSTITNTTFVDNATGFDTAGAIFNDGSIMTLTHSTITGNSAAANLGGGIANRWGSTLNLSHTIIADSPSGGDCHNGEGSTINDNGNNFIGDGSCGFALSGPLHLMPLADNGGPTRTRALVPFSNAVDAGTLNCAAADQRGLPRGGTCDSGAYEVQTTDYSTDQCRDNLAQGQTYSFGSTGVLVTVDTVGSLSQVCVRLVQTNHPDATSGLLTDRHWLITPTAAASDWSVTLSAPATYELDGDDRLCRYTGSGQVWDCGNSAATSFTPHRITRSGVIELSAWAVGTESFEVTAGTGAGNGSISPTSQVVDPGANASFTVMADTGWSVLSVTGDTCSPMFDSGTSWIASNITQACAVEANFAIDSYSVSASVGAGEGSITPPNQQVNHGASAVFSIVPDIGWSISTVSGNTCTPMPGSGDEWIAANVTADCAVTAIFAEDIFQVTATVVGGNGSIAPASQNVVFDQTASFTITPDTGWSVDVVSGDTCTPSLVSGNSWQASNVQDDCAVEARFVIDTYTVTAAVGTGEGSITPPSQSVDHGGNASFTVTPDVGWAVTAVTGDTCTPMLDVAELWIADNVTEACSVTANFNEVTHTVGGSVSGLEGSGLVLQNNHGDDLAIPADGAFTFSPQPDGSGYEVTVLTQPTGPSQFCAVANGSGTIGGSNVSDVMVACTTDEFSVGGSVSGLVGDQLVLQNNGGDDQVITADGGFAFSPQANGSAYAVTVLGQPAGQFCTVASASGTLEGSNVTDVAVSCSPLVLTPSMSEIVFNVPAGQIEQRSMFLTNTGNGSLVVQDIIQPMSPFILDDTDCSPLPLVLMPGQSCTMTVHFSAEGSGSFEDAIVVVSNTLGSPTTVTLRGNDIGAAMPVPVLGRPWLVGMILLLMLIASRTAVVHGSRVAKR